MLKAAADASYFVFCRSFVERCRQCDPQSSEESGQRANSSLDRIINQSVKVLADRLFEHIRVRTMNGHCK